MQKPELTGEYCRGRQQRLLDVMRREKLDLTILVRPEHVQWLAGPYVPRLFSAAVALGAAGHCTVVIPEEGVVDPVAADEVLKYDAQWLATLRNDQPHTVATALLKALRANGLDKAKRVGVEFASCGPYLSSAILGELVDVEQELFALRRRKDPDELACIRFAIDATEAMYVRAREVIRPGVNELEVFNQLQAAAVETLGEVPTATGNDYACGVPGGPARDRKIEDGELYILDLGPAYRGYYADNCRAFAVNGKPTALQQRAWQEVAAVFPLVEKTVRPSGRCRELFEEVLRGMEAFQPDGFSHHLGHGIGLYPHEAPHLNPNWDDRFEVGDVFTVEPGLYSDELRGGIRLENNYLVTEDGVELLSDFSLSL